MAQPDYKPHERSPLAPCAMDRSVTFVKSECGCTVEGCGHLPDPVRPKLCAKHAAAPDLYAALLALTEALNSKFVHVEATKEMATKLEAAEAQARAALAKAEGRDG